MKAIEIEHLSYAYGRNAIFEDVNLSIEENDFVALIGPNGGGKSTLMKLMVGLLKPAKGNVHLFGNRMPVKKIALGYVPQNTGKNAEFPITVGECVASGHTGLTLRSKSVADALARVDLLGFVNRRLGELSGGERQRALIARALVSNPKILFLDEPTNNMDTLGQQSLYRLLSDLASSMTIVIVTHDIMTLSSRIKSIVCVNHSVHYHEGGHVSPQMFSDAYGCEVELIAHGVPHRVLGSHDHAHGGCCEGDCHH